MIERIIETNSRGTWWFFLDNFRPGEHIGAEGLTIEEAKKEAYKMLKYYTKPRL